MNSEDFDFSVKGKGHHNKGKSPIKKNEPENSKENRVSRKSATPVVSKRNTPKTSTTPKTSNTPKTNATPKTSTTPIERPKRELRKRLRSEPVEEPVIEPEPEEEDDMIDDFDDDEISNVKLKVKVGYTATGAMIRPSTNGNRKKKRRFRNLNVKKSKSSAVKPVPKPAALLSKKTSPAAPVSARNQTKEDDKESLASLRTRQTSRRKRKGKAAEPVAGPSGLQRVKRSPRRILKRKGNAAASADDDEEDDDEDLDYVCSLYPDQSQSAKSSDSNANDGPNEGPSEGASDTQQVNDEDAKPSNGVVNGAKDELHSTTNDSHSEPQASANGENNPLSVSAEMDSVESSVIIEEEPVHMEEMEINDGNMQVVVIGDSVDVHNYAKPHSLS